LFGIAQEGVTGLFEVGRVPFTDEAKLTVQQLGFGVGLMMSVEGLIVLVKGLNFLWARMPRSSSVYGSRVEAIVAPQAAG
jgi:hypothetical protein